MSLFSKKWRKDRIQVAIISAVRHLSRENALLSPTVGGATKQDSSRIGQSNTRYVRTMNINKDTNTDTLSEVEICTEARLSKNRARVKLLQHIA